MGAISDALKNQSSYAAKKTGLWDELMSRLTDCVMSRDVDAFEEYLLSIDLQIPGSWRETLAEIIEKRRQEIDEDDIATILRMRYDF